MKKRFVILDITYIAAFILVCLIVFFLIKGFRVEKKEFGVSSSENVLLKQQDNCLLFKYDNESTGVQTGYASKKNISDSVENTDLDSTEDGWIKAYDLDKLRNEVIDKGKECSKDEKSFEFRVYKDMIQWSFLGEDNWHDLINIYDIIEKNDGIFDGEGRLDEKILPPIKNDIVIAVDNNINDLGCYNNGTVCENGTLFTIKVNNDIIYNFYVIADDGNKITLIMDSNLVNDAIKTLPWVDEDYMFPINLFEKLNYLTREWTNIDVIEHFSYEFSDEFNIDITDGNSNIVDWKAGEIEISGVARARLLSVEEAKLLGCNKPIVPPPVYNNDNSAGYDLHKPFENDFCPYWIYKNLGGISMSSYPYGYWIISPVNYSDEPEVLTITNVGKYQYNSIMDSDRFGIRPVISIKRGI